MLLNFVLLNFIPLAMALGSLAIGIGALVAPHASSVMYGAPTDDPAFVKASGIRDFFITFVIFGLWREDEIRLMALSFFALAIVSLGDAYTTWTAGNRRRTPLHLAGAIGSAGYACVVLWWIR